MQEGDVSVLASSKVSHDGQRREDLCQTCLISTAIHLSRNSAPGEVVHTDSEMSEGFVYSKDVARCRVRGLFWRLQIVMCHDIIARVDALPEHESARYMGHG